MAKNTSKNRILPILTVVFAVAVIALGAIIVSGAGDKAAPEPVACTAEVNFSSIGSPTGTFFSPSDGAEVMIRPTEGSIVCTG